MPANETANATDTDGRTALEVAVRCGNTASAMALVDGTTDIDHARRTMEFEFTSSGDGGGDAGSDGDAGGDTELVSPLELACLLGHGELARELVRRDCGDLSMVSPRVATAIASQGGAVAALASDPMNAEPVCPQGMWLCGAPCAWLCACVAVCGCLVCSPCDVPVCVCACAVAAVIESLADRGFAFDVPQVAAAVAAPTLDNTRAALEAAGIKKSTVLN